MRGSSTRQQIGAVAIGRNEGARLAHCLNALIPRVAAVVYVDSGSIDESVSLARRLGAAVVELDSSAGFTAARARNAGLIRLLELAPSVAFVQFVDGDCELVEGWLDAGEAYLRRHGDVGVVSGRRRERYPEASVYNRLCDMEWNTPVGEARTCHGDAMMRVHALHEAGGFREAMIAGEEPELCVRIRARGWRIVRLDCEMTRHDAAMTRFGQWWRRAIRAGHAYAEGAWLHGTSDDRHNVRPVAAMTCWGIVVPAVALGLAWPTAGLSALLVLGYAVPVSRAYQSRRKRGDPHQAAMVYALFNVLGKFAETTGMGLFIWRRIILRRSGTLLEYKDVASGSPQPEPPSA